LVGTNVNGKWCNSSQAVEKSNFCLVVENIIFLNLTKIYIGERYYKSNTEKEVYL
jgi:hypothetical protein